MNRDEAHEVAKRTGLKVDRSPIGNNVWGVRTPPQEGMSEGRLLTHLLEVAQYLEESNITKN